MRKDKVEDRFEAEIHNVICKKDAVPLYLIQGLESGTIKTIHRGHMILLKESTTVRESTPTIHEIVTWDNMKNKSYERDHDEDYQIKKQLNQKVDLHFGESINIQSDYKLVIDTTISEADIDSNLNTASENKLTSAIITVKHNCKEKVRIALQYIRRDLSCRNWTKFIISTQNHVIYNMLIEEVCTMFPKTQHHSSPAKTSLNLTMIQTKNSCYNLNQMSLIDRNQTKAIKQWTLNMNLMISTVIALLRKSDMDMGIT